MEHLFLSFFLPFVLKVLVAFLFFKQIVGHPTEVSYGNATKIRPEAIIHQQRTFLSLARDSVEVSCTKKKQTKKTASSSVHKAIVDVDWSMFIFHENGPSTFDVPARI